MIEKSLKDEEFLSFLSLQNDLFLIKSKSQFTVVHSTFIVFIQFIFSKRALNLIAQTLIYQLKTYFTYLHHFRIDLRPFGSGILILSYKDK